jgi:hypothetical protein
MSPQIKGRFIKNSHLLKASGSIAVHPEYKGRGTDKCRGNEKDMIMDLIHCPVTGRRLGVETMISSPLGWCSM